MTNATEKFIRFYEDLAAEVNRRAGATSSRSFEIEQAANRDGMVRRQVELLRYIRDVRNLIQHPKHRSPGPAVAISEPFLEEIDELLKQLRNPPTAGSMGVARKQIRIAGLTDRLGDLADEMKRRGYSHVPILDERDVVIGVFNEAAVFDYLWSQTEIIIGRDMQIADIMDYCRLDANHAEIFKFVSPRTSLEDLVEMFSGVESQNTRIGAAFVTPSGKRSEPLSRLITPWDVLARSTRQ